MSLNKIKRAHHIKYGIGYIITDIENMCLDNEVLFMPDDGITDRTDISGGGMYAHFVPAKYDIVNMVDINTLN